MGDNRPTIFFSYSSADRGLLDELLAAVRPALRNVAAVDPWVDRDRRRDQFSRCGVQQCENGE